MATSTDVNPFPPPATAQYDRGTSVRQQLIHLHEHTKSTTGKAELQSQTNTFASAHCASSSAIKSRKSETNLRDCAARTGNYLHVWTPYRPHHPQQPPRTDADVTDQRRSKRTSEMRRAFRLWARQQGDLYTDTSTPYHKIQEGSWYPPSIPTKYDICSPPTSLAALSFRLSMQQLPWRYELAAPVHLVNLIANFLEDLVAVNNRIPLTGDQITRFHSKRAPSMSLREYLGRLAHLVTLSSPLLLCMVVYIRRLCNLNPALPVSSLTVHRLLLSCATVASKGLNDYPCSNMIYAHVGGVRTAELLVLELDLLTRLGWDVLPPPEELAESYFELVKRDPGYIIYLDF
ncbi:hypothetical protein BBP40_010941 [Aspergillus hancockii]|nr:hypothetical protein BBP40_010941 [Aspergillus hancockii]